MDGMSMTASTQSGASFTSSSTFDSIAPTASSGGRTGQMGNKGMADNSCRVSMLWNWETIDACFLSESWQIRSRGAFAGLCIGAMLLVMLLELLRRAAKVYDRYLIRQHHETATALAATVGNNSSDTASGALIVKENTTVLGSVAPFRPNAWQQAIRALLHTLHFALAYWIMLLAMYYNGYIIICIIIGAFIGFFAFQWEHVGGLKSGDGISTDNGRDSTGCHG
ncbi:Ctr-domain-containing protein [Jackrogersella minutella]|nr:Ctr-domain-containing protein [Jackrogersella minutella]